MARPWGRLDLTANEWQQTLLGNRLLRTTYVLATAAYNTQTSVLIEHPAPPDDWCPSRPSSWNLPEVQWIRDLPAAELNTIDQCEYGCTAKKPTCIQALNLPELGEAIRAHPTQGRCSHRRHTGMFGLDEATGERRTTALKVYPSAPCRLMANAIVQRGATHLNHDWDPHPLPHNFARFWTPLGPYMDFTATHDCHRPRHNECHE